MEVVFTELLFQHGAELAIARLRFLGFAPTVADASKQRQISQGANAMVSEERFVNLHGTQGNRLRFGIVVLRQIHMRHHPQAVSDT